MIEKVIGKVDGTDVIFTDIGGGRWTITVPFDEDGEYIVEVTAIDTAGNVSYVTRYLLIVDVSNLTCKLIPLPYVSIIQPRQYEAVLINSLEGR